MTSRIIFRYFFIAETEKGITPKGKVQITKCLTNNKAKEKFKNALQEMTWDDVISSKQTGSAYEAFLNKFTLTLYDKIFEKFTVTVKSETLKNPWITKGILKSSKTKQRLYDKFLKSKTYEHEISYKNYRKLFESIKQRAKSQYYSKMILHYKDNIKKTWQIMKEVIGKGKLVNNSLPKHLILNNRNIFDQKTIANSFNEYFVNVGPKLACEIPQSQRSFEMYLKESDSSFEEVTLSDEKIKTAFFTFPEIMKIARVAPVFKSGDTSLMTNYRPISVLPCFSKMLERIMYNRLY